MIRPPPKSPLFPYTPLSRSDRERRREREDPAGDQTGEIDDIDDALQPPHPFPVVLHLLDAADRAQLGHLALEVARADRKSTRLNSSHSQISYAVFCLKKKTH